MARRKQEYETSDIRVRFDPNLCIHTARCLAGLPAVFDVQRRQWVTPEAASPDEVAEVVRRCPSGALQYERLDGGPAEEADAEASIRTVEDGPVYVRGEVAIIDAAGGVMAAGPRFALCRCGQSENKPFCDNSHRRVGFRAG
ncbi:MAG: (4Fe-4S)-binding protein [Dehalococcoidia bacterium]